MSRIRSFNLETSKSFSARRGEVRDEKSVTWIFLCAIFKPKHVWCITQNLHCIVWEQLRNKLKKITREQRKEFPADPEMRKNYSSPQLEIILLVITPLPTGQRTSVLSVSVSYLGQQLISFQTALALSSINEEGKALVDPGEERDEVIRTSQGIRLI